jgi:hypothetical protein
MLVVNFLACKQSGFCHTETLKFNPAPLLGKIVEVSQVSTNLRYLAYIGLIECLLSTARYDKALLNENLKWNSKRDTIQHTYSGIYSFENCNLTNKILNAKDRSATRSQPRWIY